MRVRLVGSLLDLGRRGVVADVQALVVVLGRDIVESTRGGECTKGSRLEGFAARDQLGGTRSAREVITETEWHPSSRTCPWPRDRTVYCSSRANCLW